MFFWKEAYERLVLDIWLLIADDTMTRHPDYIKAMLVTGRPVLPALSNRLQQLQARIKTSEAEHAEQIADLTSRLVEALKDKRVACEDCSYRGQTTRNCVSEDAAKSIGFNGTWSSSRGGFVFVSSVMSHNRPSRPCPYFTPKEETNETTGV